MKWNRSRKLKNKYYFYRHSTQHTYNIWTNEKKTAYHQHNFMHTRILVILHLLTIHSFHATNCRLTYSNELKIIYYFGKGYHMTRTKEYINNIFEQKNKKYVFTNEQPTYFVPYIYLLTSFIPSRHEFFLMRHTGMLVWSFFMLKGMPWHAFSKKKN